MCVCLCTYVRVCISVICVSPLSAGDNVCDNSGGVSGYDRDWDNHPSSFINSRYRNVVADYSVVSHSVFLNSARTVVGTRFYILRRKGDSFRVEKFGTITPSKKPAVCGGRCTYIRTYTHTHRSSLTDAQVTHLLAVPVLLVFYCILLQLCVCTVICM